MPKIFSRISPIKPIATLGIEEISIETPQREDFSIYLEIEIPKSGETPVSNLPVQSYVKEYLLLEASEVISPVQIPIIDPKETRGYLSPSLFSKLNSSDSVSNDVFRSVRFSPTSTFPVRLEILKQIDRVQISENLLQKIASPEKVSGMLYSDRYWKTEQLPGISKNPNGGQKKHRRNLIRPTDLHEINGKKVPHPRYKLSLWDLIFVLLQPPLEFGVNESLLLPHDLYPYQIEGVRFLISNEHALLADDMGTGKTVMTTVSLKILLRANKIKRVLILCPPSVLYEWKRHLADWAPEMITCFIRGTQDVRTIEWKTPAHIYITTYDTLKGDVDNGLLPKEKWDSFDAVIIDEAHHIKNSSTNRSKAIRKLKTTYHWALTGTPIQNKIEDMAALFDFIYPNFISPYDLYPEKIKNKVAPYFLRRRKQEVLKDLPDKLKQDIWLEMTNEQKAEYDKVEKEVRSELESLGSGVTRQHIFAKMQRLKQICNFPTNKNSSPKLEILKEQVEEIIDSGNKVIIFSQYVDQGVKKLYESLRSYGTATIIGGQSDSIRKAEIERFKYSDKTPLLIASIKSGGEGLNLTEASYVVHFDHWWNPAVMWQAEDRVHRRGQKNKVNIYSYWMSDTIDERIHNILEHKGLLIENVVDGLSENMVEELITMDDLLDIIGIKKPETRRPTFDVHRWINLELDQIKDKLLEISPREFEELVEQLMFSLGYPNVKVTKRTGDGGIDVISTRIAENGVERVAAQCKRYKSPIGVPIAREFLGAIQDDKTIVRGYLVTTSVFTPECISYCVRNKIEMIPGIKIAEYVKQFGLEV